MSVRIPRNVSEIPLPEISRATRLPRWWFKIAAKDDARSIIAFITLIIVGGSQVLAAASSGVSTVVAIAGIAIGFVPGHVTWLLIAALSTTTFGTTIYAFFVRRKLAENLSMDIWKKDFEPVQRIVMAYVQNKKEITYRFRYIVRPKRDLRQLKFQYAWSGFGDVVPKSLNPQHTILSHTRVHKANTMEVVVDFGRSINSKNLELFDLELFTRADQEPLPYISIPVRIFGFSKVDMHLMAAFSEEVSISAIYKERTWVGKTDEIEEAGGPEQLPDSRIAQWKVPARFGARYVLRWVYNETYGN